MTEQTREEVDAKIGAAEARTDTKITRMEGKLDLLLSEISNVNARIGDVRDDSRSTRSNLWAVALGLAALIVGVAFGLPAIYGFGFSLRDVVHKEVQESGCWPTLSQSGRI